MTMSGITQDVRYGTRTLLRAPGFTAIAILVLSLGVGVNTAVFSLANALFLRPLPVADPGGLVRVYSSRHSNTRHPLYEQLRSRNATLSGLAGFQVRSFGMRAGGDTEHVFGEVITGDYFPVVGLQPAVGRLLAPPDDRPGAPPAVVLSHAFWTRRFGAAPDVVGQSLTLNGQPFAIVGVAPREFTGLLAPLVGDLWVPLAADPLLRPGVDPATRFAGISLHLAGRLKPGVDRAQAQADLDTIGRSLREPGAAAEDIPAVTVYGASVLHPEIAEPVGIFTAILMTLVAIVLLIVCVNLANLTLARAAGRDVEIAVRQSLGAGRGRVVRQLLTESLLLALGGAAVGLMLAFWATRALMVVQLPVPVPIGLDLAPDVRVTAFTALVACLATMAFGVMPALGASRVDLVSALKGSAGSGARHGRLRASFLVAQVAMSVLLLVVAGLFVRSARNAGAIETGFDASHVMTAMVDLETRGYTAARGRDFIRAVTERLASAPGVVAANVVEVIPLTLSNQTTYVLRDGDPRPAPGERPVTPLVYVNNTGPGHFETLKIPLRAGRDFTQLDTDSAPPVVIVNETMAQRFWPGGSAVGQRLRPFEDVPNARDLTVVGVVADSKVISLGEEPMPFLYRPIAQEYKSSVSLMVRSSGDAAAAVATLRREVQSLDAGLPLFNVMSMADATSVSQLPVRVAGALLAVLGVFALVLAALGIYGVLSYIVRSRTREIGVRVAIGASPGAVVGMVVRQAMTWTVVGAAIGLALAFGTTRFLVSLLFGIAPTDPWTLAGVTVLLTAVACVAAVVPAIRASRLDPLVALRSL